MGLTNNRWHVVKNYDAGFVGVGCNISWTCLGIADIHHDVPNIQERVEVAELISLAPTLKKENEKLQATNQELLSALEAIRDIADHPPKDRLILEVAEKAITNAKQMGDSDESH